MNESNKNITVTITGMTCDHCARSIEKLFQEKDGILAKSVSYQTGKGEFTYDSEKTDPEKIAATINQTKNYKVKSIVSSGNGRYHYDLIIIGGGSAAFAAAIKSNEAGLSTLIVNDGLPIGGTCVNVGCLPSKHLIRAAESIHRASVSPFEGIRPVTPNWDFKRIIQQKNELVATMRKKKYLDVVRDFENLTILKGRASFVDTQTITVNNVTYTARNFLIATGATTHIPKIEGLEKTGFLTHTTLFDLKEKPESLTIMGAGYIGLEIAMAYNRFRTKIRIIEFTDRVLRSQTADISAEIEKHLRNEGIEFFPNYRVENVERTASKIIITGKDVKSGREFTFEEAGEILVATGITPNTQEMGLEKIGIATDESGHILVNEFLQTSVSNIYAAGDCNQNPAYVYTAAYEGNLSVQSMLTRDGNEMKAANYTGLPWVIFTDPQVAGVGIDEEEAKKKGLPYEISVVALDDVPRFAAALDTKGFIKLIRNPDTDELLGARVIAPEGGELVMELSLAMKYRINVSELANSFHPYLTASEGIKLAAIGFRKDVATLSCCAV
jgi:mercuric reductase